MVKIEKGFKKKRLYRQVLKDKSINIASCGEEDIYKIQQATGDTYQLNYLGIDAEYDFYLALKKDNVLGYSIVQKYFEYYYFYNDKGRHRGEPALVYSLEKKKGIGSLLFLVSSLEILKDERIEVFRCETVKDNVFDKMCPQLGLKFTGEKEIFNFYELPLEKNNRNNLEKKVKEFLKAL